MHEQSNCCAHSKQKVIIRDVAAKKTEETNKEQMLHDMEEQALEDYKVFLRY